MTLLRCSPDEAASRLSSFSAIIDARSETEFALDHLPGAVNWPTLNDAQRAEVGTEYKQISAFEARKRGAAMAARNIAGHLERETGTLQRDWRPLVYCWRGGQRSGSLALVLSQIGFDVTVLDGGYRGFRKTVLEALETLPLPLQLKVLCGTTGSGKSRLLAELARQGAQVLDLEDLACHRGSVLGALDGGQPSQKAFETRLWAALRQFDAQRPVFVESESRTIGRLRLPEALLTHMRASACIRLDMPQAARVDLLMADYPHHQTDVEGFCQRLDALREIRGNDVINRWQTQARRSEWPLVVAELLDEHYDPIYLRSINRNFYHFSAAHVLNLADGHPETLVDGARELVHRFHAEPGAPPA
jgi:tRNA 2-selenouridine synthase